MTVRLLALLVFALAMPGQAQETDDVAAGALRALSGTGAILRGLDKTSGDVSDIEMSEGETVTFGRLDITVGQCRYPEDNPAGEAYAWIEIHDRVTDRETFAGWMIASSPALNALDHARYDVWVIRCTTR